MDIGLARPSVTRRAHLMTPQLIPSPLPAKDRKTPVEEPIELLATAPTQPGRPAITMATEFGYMVGHRMSVAPMCDVVGDTLPGFKARRILGIRTSSGFEESEFDDDARTMLARSRSDPSRSPSPSFVHAVSSMVRRASARTTSSAPAPQRRRRADSQPATDYGDLVKRKGSLTQIFSRSTLRDDGSGSQLASPSSHDDLRPHYNKIKGGEAGTDTVPSMANAGDRLAAYPVPVVPSSASQRLPSMLIQSTQDFESDTLDALFRASSSNYSPPGGEEEHLWPSDSSCGPLTETGSTSARSSSPSSIWSCETGTSMVLEDFIRDGRLVGKITDADLSKGSESSFEDMRFLRPRPAPAPPITPFSNLARLESSLPLEEPIDDGEEHTVESTDNPDTIDKADEDDPLREIIDASTPEELQRALESGQFGTSKARKAKTRSSPLTIETDASAVCQRKSRAVPVDECPDNAVTPGRVVIDRAECKTEPVSYDSDDALDNIILDLPSPLHPMRRRPEPLAMPPKSPYRRPKRYALPI